MHAKESHQQTRHIRVDLRALAAVERRARVFSAYAALQPGEKLELTHFHHSTPLRYLLLAEAPGSFTWEYLEQGPAVWRMLISKRPKHRDETAIEHGTQAPLVGNSLH